MQKGLIFDIIVLGDVYMDDFILKLAECKDEEVESLVAARVEQMPKQNVGTKPPKIYGAISPFAYRGALEEDTRIELGGGFGFGEILNYYFDITKEICDSLTAKIRQKMPQNFRDVATMVAKTIFDYIGNPEVRTVKDRLSHLKEDDELAKGERNYISAFKGTGDAWCMERSAMAHQLFKFLGYDAELVTSQIMIDGKTSGHAFNLIKLEDQVVMFDLTMLDYSKGDPSKSCIVFDNLPFSCYDKVENLPERVFKSKTNQERHCQINPYNKDTVVYGKEEPEQCN